MTRPKYLQDQDTIQDSLQELGQATIVELIAHTKLSYEATRMACQRLADAGRIRREQAGRAKVITFHYK
jgi:hypothetical protein